MEVYIVILMLAFLFLGMPVAFSLGVAGAIGLVLVGGLDSVFTVLATVPFRTAAHYSLSALPMFILMANFVSASKIVDDIFLAAQRWLERLPGGLAIASVIAGAGMAAMAGSSTASAATLSTVAVPQMKKYGYSDEVSTGVVTVAGTLAIMIPPSVGFILYGIITETSIGQLFIAGIIPGIINASLYCIAILVWKKMSPDSMPPSTSIYSMKERLESLKPLWAFILLAFTVIGSMYAGLATVTEAASFGAFGALVIPLALRRMTRKAFTKAVINSIKATTMIFTIIIGAMIFGYFLTLTQSIQNVINMMGSLEINRWLILVLFALLYIVLGCIMDQIAILLITLPLVFPIIVSFDFDPIWFGVVSVELCEIGLITPPVGMNEYVVSAATDVPLSVVFKGTGVLLIAEFTTLIILILFPSLCTWLPSKMIGG